MSDEFKILAQAFPEDTDEADFYRVPIPDSARDDKTQTLVTSLTVCSHGGVGEDSSFRLRLKQEITGFVIPDDDKQWLFFDAEILAGEERTLSLGLALPGDALLKIRSEHADRLSFNLVGIEVT